MSIKLPSKYVTASYSSLLRMLTFHLVDTSSVSSCQVRSNFHKGGAHSIDSARLLAKLACQLRPHVPSSGRVPKIINTRIRFWIILAPLIICKVVCIVTMSVSLYYINWAATLDDTIKEEQWFIAERAFTMVDNRCVHFRTLECTSYTLSMMISYASILFLRKLLPALRFEKSTMADNRFGPGSSGKIVKTWTHPQWQLTRTIESLTRRM
jgi:hypothetical protein